ncbi:CBN-SOP-2 protein [Caenorhabditis brenneri]|uniref:CBN-SOP-2 protein n=1 Tax=Caenorhabditis brenneri TaxID=135651 RepID=G0MH83_CAEBE|nr:CBN-SOP-2 protein [Caenorhabditis brenneri]
MSNERVQSPHRDLPGGLPDHMRAIIEGNRANGNGEFARRAIETGRMANEVGNDGRNGLEGPKREKDIETILTEASEEDGAWLKRMHPNEMLLIFTRCDANDATYRKLVGEPPLSGSRNQGQHGNAARVGNNNGFLTNRALEPVVPPPIVVKQEVEDGEESAVPQQAVPKEEPKTGHADDPPIQLPADVKREVDDDEMSELQPVLSDYGSVRGEMSDGSLLGYESEQSQGASSRDDMPILMPQNGDMDGMPVLKREVGSPDSLPEQMPALKRQRKQAVPTHIPRGFNPLQLYRPRGPDLLQIYFITARLEVLDSLFKKEEDSPPVSEVPTTVAPERKNRRKQAKPTHIPPESLEQPEPPEQEQPIQKQLDQEQPKQDKRNELPSSTPGIAREFFSSNVANKSSLDAQWKWLQGYKPPPPSEEQPSSSVKIEPSVKPLSKVSPKMKMQQQKRSRGRPRAVRRIPGQPRKKDRESIRTPHFDAIRDFDLFKRKDLRIKVYRIGRRSRNYQLTITRNKKAGYQPYTKFPYSVLFGQYNWSYIGGGVAKSIKKYQLAKQAKAEAKRQAQEARKAAREAKRAAKKQSRFPATTNADKDQQTAQSVDMDKQIALAVQDQEYGAELPQDVGRVLQTLNDNASSGPSSSNSGCITCGTTTTATVTTSQAFSKFDKKCLATNTSLTTTVSSTPTFVSSTLTTKEDGKSMRPNVEPVVDREANDKLFGKEATTSQVFNEFDEECLDIASTTTVTSIPIIVTSTLTTEKGENSMKPNVEPVVDQKAIDNLLGEEKAAPMNGEPENNVADKREDTAPKDDQVNQRSTPLAPLSTGEPEVMPAVPVAALPQSEEAKFEGAKDEAVKQKASEATQEREDLILQPEALPQEVDEGKEIPAPIEDQAAEQEMKKPKEQAADATDQLHRGEVLDKRREAEEPSAVQENTSSSVPEEVAIAEATEPNAAASEQMSGVAEQNAEPTDQNCGPTDQSSGAAKEHVEATDPNSVETKQNAAPTEQKAGPTDQSSEAAEENAGAAKRIAHATEQNAAAAEQDAEASKRNAAASERVGSAGGAERMQMDVGAREIKKEVEEPARNATVDDEAKRRVVMQHKEQQEKKKAAKEEKEAKERAAKLAKEKRNPPVPPSQRQNEPGPSGSSSSQANQAPQFDPSRVKQEAEEVPEEQIDPVVQNAQKSVIVPIKQEVEEGQAQPVVPIKRRVGRPCKTVPANPAVPKVPAVTIKPDPDAAPAQNTPSLPRQYNTRRSAAQSNDLPPPANASKSNNGHRSSTQTSVPKTEASSSAVSSSNAASQPVAGSVQSNTSNTRPARSSLRRSNLQIAALADDVSEGGRSRTGNVGSNAIPPRTSLRRSVVQTTAPADDASERARSRSGSVHSNTRPARSSLRRSIVRSTATTDDASEEGSSMAPLVAKRTRLPTVMPTGSNNNQPAARSRFQSPSSTTSVRRSGRLQSQTPSRDQQSSVESTATPSNDSKSRRSGVQTSVLADDASERGRRRPGSVRSSATPIRSSLRRSIVRTTATTDSASERARSRSGSVHSDALPTRSSLRRSNAQTTAITGNASERGRSRSGSVRSTATPIRTSLRRSIVRSTATTDDASEEGSSMAPLVAKRTRLQTVMQTGSSNDQPIVRSRFQSPSSQTSVRRSDRLQPTTPSADNQQNSVKSTATPSDNNESRKSNVQWSDQVQPQTPSNIVYQQDSVEPTATSSNDNESRRSGVQRSDQLQPQNPETLDNQRNDVVPTATPSNGNEPRESDVQRSDQLQPQNSETLDNQRNDVVPTATPSNNNVPRRSGVQRNDQLQPQNQEKDDNQRNDVVPTATPSNGNEPRESDVQRSDQLQPQNSKTLDNQRNDVVPTATPSNNNVPRRSGVQRNDQLQPQNQEKDDNQRNDVVPTATPSNNNEPRRSGGQRSDQLQPPNPETLDNQRNDVVPTATPSNNNVPRRSGVQRNDQLQPQNQEKDDNQRNDVVPTATPSNNNEPRRSGGQRSDQLQPPNPETLDNQRNDVVPTATPSNDNEPKKSNVRRSDRLQPQTPKKVANQRNDVVPTVTPSNDNAPKKNGVQWSANVVDNTDTSSVGSRKRKGRMSEADRLNLMDFGPKEGGTLGEIQLAAERSKRARTVSATMADEEPKRAVTRRSASQKKAVVDPVESGSESEEDDAFEDEEGERDDDDEDFVPQGLDRNERRKIAEEKERLEKERLQKEKLEKERQKKERLEKQKLEKERLQKQKLEEERAKKAKSQERNSSALAQSQDVIVIDDLDETERDDFDAPGPSGPGGSGIIYPNQLRAMYSDAPPAKKFKAAVFSFPPSQGNSSTSFQMSNNQPPAPRRERSTQSPNVAPGGIPFRRTSNPPIYTGSSTVPRQQGNQPNTSSRGSSNLPPASVAQTSSTQNGQQSRNANNQNQPGQPKFPVKQIPRPTQQPGQQQPQYQAQRQSQPQGQGQMNGSQRNQPHPQQQFQHSDLLQQMQWTLKNQQAMNKYLPILPRPSARTDAVAAQQNQSGPRSPYYHPYQRPVPLTPAAPQVPQQPVHQAPRQNQQVNTHQQAHQRIQPNAQQHTYPQAPRNVVQQVPAQRTMQRPHVNRQLAGQTPENPIVISDATPLRAGPAVPELTVRQYLANNSQHRVPQQRARASQQRTTPPQNSGNSPQVQMPQRAAPHAPQRAQPSPQAPADPQALKKQAPLLYAELTGQPPAVVIVPETFTHKDLRKDLFPLQAMHKFEAKPELPPLHISNNAVCLIPENRTNDFMQWNREDLLNWGRMFLDEIGQREMQKLYEENIDGTTLPNMFDSDARTQLPPMSAGTFFKIRNNAAAVVNRYNELRHKHYTALFEYMESQTQ